MMNAHPSNRALSVRVRGAALVAMIVTVTLLGCTYAVPVLENPLDPSVSVPLEEITFGDPDFANIVANSTQNGEGTNNVFRIEADADLVTSIEGIQYLSNLEELYLWGPSGISDLTPLSQLRRLRRIQIDGAAITDLAPLASVTSLVAVDFRDNNLTSLAPLPSLPKLDRVWLSGLFSGPPGFSGPVDDIVENLAVAGLGLFDFDLSDPGVLSLLDGRGYTSLWLGGCNLGAFPTTPAVRAVEELAVQGDPTITSLPAVSVSFPSLLYLNVSGLNDPGIAWNDLLNIDAPNLREIQARDLSSVSTWPNLSAAFPNLEAVHLSYGAFTSLDMLVGLGSLRSVGFEGNPVTNFSALAQLDTVEEIYLRNTGFSNADFLYVQQMDSLRNLEIPNNPGVTSLGAVANMNIDYLHIANATGITTLELDDIAGVQTVYAADEDESLAPSIAALGPALPPTSIEHLDLTGQLLTDVSELSTLTGLRELRLADNNISSGVTNLAALSNLTYLDLRNNPVSTEDVETLRAALPNAFIDF